MSQEAVLETRALHFSYGRQEILRDINLTVHRGDYVGLIGPNGSGKTTLLRLMLGLETPQRGEIRLFGEPLQAFRNWAKIGYVAQKAAAFNAAFPATAAEIVATGRIAGRGLFRRLGREDRDAVHEALDRVGMAAFAGRQIGRLSGGQQQRVFIARALASRPELLILDEPTVGVDPGSQEQFYSLLRDLHRNMSLTIILVSHDVGVVASEVTELACLNRTLFFCGSPRDFGTQEQLIQLYGYPVAAVHHHHH